MADNVTANAGSGGATFAVASLSFSGDTAGIPLGSGVILTGSEGSWTSTLIVGGAGAVTAGTQRVTLASDDPAVSQITSLNGKVTACNTGAVVVSSSALPSGAATATKQPALGTAGTASSDVLTVQGIASMTALKVDGTGGSFPVTDSGGSLTVDNGGTFAVQATVAAGAATIGKAEDVASADADVGVPSMAIRKATPANTSGTDGDYEMLQMSAGRLWTSTAIDTALPAGTNAIGKLAANSGVTIGAVEIASAQTLGTVTTVSTLTGGGVAHDGVDSGNPVKIGGRAVSSLASATLVAAADRSDLVTDIDGSLIVRLNRPMGDGISERVTDTGGTSTAFTNFGAVASTRNVITSIVVYNSSATAGFVDFRDGTGGAVLWTMPLPAGGGAVLSQSNALFRTSANTALAYDVSGALTTVYISVSGFQSKV